MNKKNICGLLEKFKVDVYAWRQPDLSYGMALMCRWVVKIKGRHSRCQIKEQMCLFSLPDWGVKGCCSRINVCFVLATAVPVKFNHLRSDKKEPERNCAFSPHTDKLNRLNGNYRGLWLIEKLLQIATFIGFHPAQSSFAGYFDAWVIKSPVRPPKRNEKSFSSFLRNVTWLSFDLTFKGSEIGDKKSNNSGAR